MRCNSSSPSSLSWFCGSCHVQDLHFKAVYYFTSVLHKVPPPAMGLVSTSVTYNLQSADWTDYKKVNQSQSMRRVKYVTFLRFFNYRYMNFKLVWRINIIIIIILFIIIFFFRRCNRYRRALRLKKPT